ncbi:MAG: hypothetical protein JXA60_12485 [Candidatus Coatesbacteria bacterium]|nr:hypothetical protein [Candidatus Coatesbacteria bacterium]
MIASLIIEIILLSLFCNKEINFSGEEKIDDIIVYDTSKKFEWGWKNRIRLMLESPYSEPDKKQVRYYSSLDFYLLSGTQNPFETEYIPPQFETFKEWIDNGLIEISRLYITIPVSKGEMTVGRQRVPWGQGVYFRPLDFFNHLNSLDMTAERKGIDALKFSFPLALLSDVTLLTILDKWPGHSELGIRSHLNIESLDMGLSYSYRGKDLEGSETGSHPQVAGLDFKGDLLLGVHGEGLYRFYRTYPLEKNSFKDRIQFTLGADYSFLENRLFMLGEYFYNGYGFKDTSDYRPDDFYKGIHYGIIEISYSPNILVSYLIAGLININDDSFVITPHVKWSIFKNTSLDISLGIIEGKRYSEYDPEKIGRVVNNLKLSIVF